METPETTRMTGQPVSNHKTAVGGRLPSCSCNRQTWNNKELGGGKGTRLHIVPRRVGARRGRAAFGQICRNCRITG